MAIKKISSNSVNSTASASCGMESEGIILDLLTQEGVVYKAKFKIWRGTTKLTPEDLGLEESDFSGDDVDQMLTLGKKQLVPKKQLNDITTLERQMNTFLKSHGRQMFGSGYFIPNVLMGETEKFINEMSEKWNVATTSFINNWANIMAESRANWEKFFLGRLSSAKKQAAISSLDTHYPDIFVLRKKFNFDIYRMNLRVPEMLEPKVANIEAQMEKASARNAARESARIAAIKEAEGFVAEAITQLRADLGDVCDDLLGTITDSKVGIHQKTLNRFETIREHFKALNFTGDIQIDKLVDGLYDEASKHTAKELRDDPKALGKLAEVISLVGKQAKDLMKQDSKDVVEKFIKQGKRKIINPFED